MLLLSERDFRSRPTPYEHAYADDLESFLWVLLYHATLYLKSEGSTDKELLQDMETVFDSVDLNNDRVFGGIGKRNWLHYSSSETVLTDNLPLTKLIQDLGTYFGERYIVKHYADHKWRGPDEYNSPDRVLDIFNVALDESNKSLWPLEDKLPNLYVRMGKRMAGTAFSEHLAKRLKTSHISSIKE